MLIRFITTIWSWTFINLNSEYVWKSFVLDWNNYEIKCTAARKICERHHGGPIEGSPKTPHTSLHYDIEGFNRSPNFTPLCEEAQASRAAESTFSNQKIFRQLYDELNTQKWVMANLMGHFLMANWMGHLKIKNCQSAWNQNFGCFHGRVEVFKIIFYPVLLDKNQKLTSQCVEHRSLA